MFRIIGLCLAAAITLTGPAKADSHSIDKAAMDALFKAYIEENAEVVRDALVALANREEAERKEAAFSLLRDVDGDPEMGNPDGDIVIYEFTDYNCGYCKRVFEPIQQVLGEDGNIRFVVKEFPILSQTSLTAAQAGIAAAAQGVFTPYHVAMMTGRSAVSAESILQAAADAGADMERLQADMQSDTVNSIITRTREIAQRLEINGTPALVIGDTVVPGAIGIDELRRLIADERAKNS